MALDYRSNRHESNRRVVYRQHKSPAYGHIERLPVKVMIGNSIYMGEAQHCETCSVRVRDPHMSTFGGVNCRPHDMPQSDPFTTTTREAMELTFFIEEKCDNRLASTPRFDQPIENDIYIPKQEVWTIQGHLDAIKDFQKDKQKELREKARKQNTEAFANIILM